MTRRWVYRPIRDMSSTIPTLRWYLSHILIASCGIAALLPTKVIDHGVIAPQVRYTGKLEKGIVVINNLNERGRRLGLDIFMEVRKRVPLDLIGMDTKKIGGLGEILHPDLPEFIKDYRFMFNPIRYTSRGLP